MRRKKSRPNLQKKIISEKEIFLKWINSSKEEQYATWEPNPPIKKKLLDRQVLHRRTDLPSGWKKIEE